MYNKELSTALRAAKAAGKIMMHYYKNPKIMFKTDRSTLTNADTECEKIIKNMLKKSFPEHGFLGEETGTSPGKETEFIWVVDPIDGTTNYAMKNPFFCTSICLVQNSRPIVGVVYNPFTKELFHAVFDNGAKMNGRKITVSEKSDIGTSAVGFCYRADEESRKRASALFSALTSHTHKLRQFGAAALELSYVAAGRIDSFFMINANSWDVAAGCLLVKEAGGVVTDFQNEKWNTGKRDILAANSAIHGKILDVIKKTEKL